MPKSRKRSGRRRGKGKRGFRTELSRFFEEIGLNPEKSLPFPVLYHYTSMTGALKILESQTFWATAHGCTNDKGELTSANHVVFEIAQARRQTASGLLARVLDVFLREYESEAIAKVRTAYLICFSIARDDENQWARYGEDGRGICLAIKVINEPAPEDGIVFSRLLQVIYSEDSLREWFSDTLDKFCMALSRYPASDQNVRFAIATLRGLAAFASMTTKTSDWSAEKEIRYVTMDHFDPGVEPHIRISSDGKEIRYLPISLRTEGKLIALDEIIIGSKQNFDEARKQFESLLSSKGYIEAAIEYPKLVSSRF
jgi:Protein of unknown function (DUF2971)